MWAEHRLYPGLKSNNMLGTYEYSDFPMDPETYGVKPGEHIPGHVLYRYLTHYAEHFGVYRRIRFDTKVTAAERAESGGWMLKAETQANAAATLESSQLFARKLVVATGLTSEPFIPQIPGMESFRGLIFHSKQFQQHAESLAKLRKVTVLGGSKSAWDVAYAYATSGATVHMVIRESGQGPVWMAPPYVTPLKRWLEKLVHTRFLTWFSPCIWGDEDGYSSMRYYYHQTWIGRQLVDIFWSILSNDIFSLVGFDRHPEMKKLKPWSSAFWTGSGLGILNYPTDFMELVRNGTIRVHIADVSRLSADAVHLSSGETLKADAVVCATGWKAHPPLKFLPDRIDAQLGLPYYASPDSPEQAQAQKADAEIMERFPRLRDQPHVKVRGGDAGTTDKANQPFRLYRFMAPPSMLNTHDIAFAGMITTVTTSVCAEVQGLWISAYLDGKLDRLPVSEDDARRTTLLHSQFGRWRYPCGYGARFPDTVFDAVPYLDMLLKDVGVRNHRKAGATAEIFEPYGPEDYKDIVAEWKESHC